MQLNALMCLVKFIGTVKKGIMQGSSLLPLLGAVALLCWDKAMQKNKFTYARYIDDLVLLAPTKARI